MFKYFQPMEGNDIQITQRKRKAVGLSIMAIIILINVFRVGDYLDGELHSFYYSYVSDLIIPFGVYFLLCIAEFKILICKKWSVKALSIIGFTALAEILQFFGIYALGITFDFIDILIYVIGVGVAVILDRLLLRFFYPYWESSKTDKNLIYIFIQL